MIQILMIQVILNFKIGKWMNYVMYNHRNKCLVKIQNLIEF